MTNDLLTRLESADGPSRELDCLIAAAALMTYGDKRYQQAIADVVEWLRVQQHGRTSDNYPGYYARQIEQRLGKDA